MQEVTLKRNNISRWQFWIDRGGTFTDCLGRDPHTGTIHVAKVLSSDTAPLIGIRRLLGLADNAPIPPCDIRMGTTVATNALLERRGVACALAITRGFADLLAIGTQSRPKLFSLDIEKPTQLYREVIEIDARLDAHGEVITQPDPEDLKQQFGQLRAKGIESLAIVVIHAYTRPSFEQEIGQLAQQVGFSTVSLSAQVACEMGMLGRGDTTVVDAYLTPLLQNYLDSLSAQLPGSTLQLMQSSGGLTPADSFRGHNSVLSGPAAGVVACAHVADQMGNSNAIAFDMGGTSTDVSCYEGEFERNYETEIAGVRLRTPMMAIHTVAAGGGSICRDNGYSLSVGPDSAGATPGPLCYGHPNANQLTVTDINYALGRIVDDRFPFPLNKRPVDAALEQICRTLADRGVQFTRQQVAVGFLNIANANMAEAIRQVSIAKGKDVREYDLVVFGGAGGQHACSIAQELGIRRLIIHPLSGVLSAYGMGLAPASWHGERDGGGVLLKETPWEDILSPLNNMVSAGERKLREQGFPQSALRARPTLGVRYKGTETTLSVTVDNNHSDQIEQTIARFLNAHQKLFGYARENHPIEVASFRVEVTAYLAPPQFSLPSSFSDPPTLLPHCPLPRRKQSIWTNGKFTDANVYYREDLDSNTVLEGPALILDAASTLVVDSGFQATIGAEQTIILNATTTASQQIHSQKDADPVLLEILSNAFISIANQMGTVLRRTAISTNIRERLDYSCAVFDATGGLVANAPHIPVHLGAMSESVRSILADNPHPTPGQVFATNAPSRGGSHLPDITTVTPVHDPEGTLLFWTASRGHHADIGGTTPGSMPPFSKSLAEEGVVLDCLTIVKDGSFQLATVTTALTDCRYPARNPTENIADLQAQIAANRTGATLLGELCQRYGSPTITAYMNHVQRFTMAQVAREIERIDDGTYQFADSLDDGTKLQVSIQVARDRMTIDFTGTSPQVDGNLNAPRSVCLAAVIYVLRALVGTSIPLNSGCLQPVTVTIPKHSVLWPDPDLAVAAGNVETSQRVVDILIGALGRAAASQGTMNNITFGTHQFGHYETIAGGAGATPTSPGADAVHTHMTNTRITDPELLESRFPIRLKRFAIRSSSGGQGVHRGGNGVIREYQLLAPMQVSIVSQRRETSPFGLAGGLPGLPGRNIYNGHTTGGNVSIRGLTNDIIRIETPGGGGYGAP